MLTRLLNGSHVDLSTVFAIKSTRRLKLLGDYFAPANIEIHFGPQDKPSVISIDMAQADPAPYADELAALANAAKSTPAARSIVKGEYEGAGFGYRRGLTTTPVTP